MDLLETIDDRGVVSLTLNRPMRRNAFHPALVDGLAKALRRLDADDETRVVIVSGAGDNFCAGADIEWMRSAAHAEPHVNAADAVALAEMYATLDSLSKPTVALIQGAAFGGGVGLVACCDIAIAARNAKFCMSEVRRGLIPAVVGPYLVRAIGAHQARPLFLSAEIMRADRALAIGLIHEVAPEGGLTTVRDRIVEALLLGAPGAQTQCKRLIETCSNRRIDPSLRRETAELLATRRVSPEGVEGLNSFLEKRAPEWRGLGGA